MNDRFEAQISQLAATIGQSSAAHVAEMVRLAREQAMAEVANILKDAFVRTLLEQSLSQIRESQLCLATPTPAQPLPPGDDDQIRREIEVIRQQMAQNEQQLAQLKTASSRPAPNGSERGAVSSPTPESGCSYYVYGVVATDAQAEIILPKAGVDPDYPVYALPYRDIQAIVSQASLSEFGQDTLEARLNDLAWLKARVQAHQDIVQGVLIERAIIPMRFCTVYRSEARIEEMLAAHYDEFARLLAWLKDKQEWGVKVFCDRQVLTGYVAECSPRVKQLQAEAGRKSEGAAYFVKKKVDEAIGEDAERFGDEYTQRLHDLLAGYAEDAVVNPLQSKELTGRLEDMLLNSAYLVRQDRLPAFRAAVERMTCEGESMGLVCEVTGPWPPYNFVRTETSEDAP
jgi:hypothetical protein